MKKNIHPQSRPTVFKDTSTGKMFLVHSTVKSEQTVVYDDGNVYPVIMLSISSDSHPFYTGAQKYVDELGRIEKFKRKYKV